MPSPEKAILDDGRAITRKEGGIMTTSQGIDVACARQDGSDKANTQKRTQRLATRRSPEGKVAEEERPSGGTGWMLANSQLHDVVVIKVRTLGRTALSRPVAELVRSYSQPPQSDGLQVCVLALLAHSLLWHVNSRLAVAIYMGQFLLFALYWPGLTSWSCKIPSFIKAFPR